MATLLKATGWLANPDCRTSSAVPEMVGRLAGADWSLVGVMKLTVGAVVSMTKKATLEKLSEVWAFSFLPAGSPGWSLARAPGWGPEGEKAPAPPGLVRAHEGLRPPGRI